MSVYLLVETAQGDVVAVRFQSAELARVWNDWHDDEITVRGLVKEATRASVLKLAKAES